MLKKLFMWFPVGFCLKNKVFSTENVHKSDLYGFLLKFTVKIRFLVQSKNVLKMILCLKNYLCGSLWDVASKIKFLAHLMYVNLIYTVFG